MSAAVAVWFDRVREELHVMFFDGDPWQETVALDAFFELCRLRAETI
jgi:hypothetical protein